MVRHCTTTHIAKQEYIPVDNCSSQVTSNLTCQPTLLPTSSKQAFAVLPVQVAKLSKQLQNANSEVKRLSALLTAADSSPAKQQGAGISVHESDLEALDAASATDGQVCMVSWQFMSLLLINIAGLVWLLGLLMSKHQSKHKSQLHMQ